MANFGNQNLAWGLQNLMGLGNWGWNPQGGQPAMSEERTEDPRTGAVSVRRSQGGVGSGAGGGGGTGGGSSDYWNPAGSAYYNLQGTLAQQPTQMATGLMGMLSSLLNNQYGLQGQQANARAAEMSSFYPSQASVYTAAYPASSAINTAYMNNLGAQNVAQLNMEGKLAGQNQLLGLLGPFLMKSLGGQGGGSSQYPSLRTNYGAGYNFGNVG